MGDQLDSVGDHEHRVEADAELADQLFGCRFVLSVLRVAQLLAQLRGARFGQRADQVHHLIARHADPVVADGQGAGRLVHLDLDVQVGGVDLELFVAERLESQLVERIGGIGDELPQERILVRVHRVDHQIQQLTGLGLKFQLFHTLAHRSQIYRPVSSGRSGPDLYRIFTAR